MLKELKDRFATFETADGVLLLGTGVALILGLATGLLPIVAFILIVSGGYKIAVKRNGK